MDLHPAARILLYVLSALAVPGLSLLWTGLLLAAAALFAGWHPRATWNLFRRARWLFLLMWLAYAYGMPGQMAWPALATWSPSLEGVQAGSAQVARLALLLLALEILVLSMRDTRLLAGLYQIFQALAPLGVSSERLTVRLALTLQALQGRAQGGRTNVLAWLDESLPAGPVVTSLTLEVPPWLWRDTWVLLAGLGLTGVAWRFG